MTEERGPKIVDLISVALHWIVSTPTSYKAQIFGLKGDNGIAC